jgi:hypothetical protein
MNSIVQEFLITVQMFSEKNNSELNLIMLKYIKYIIHTTIDELRKNPYLIDDEEESDEELTDMSYYFSEV